MCCDVTDTPDYVTIYKAITILNSMTCVQFVPWNGKDKDFLLIWPVKKPKGYVTDNSGNHGSADI
jgi:hypothetical protein